METCSNRGKEQCTPYTAWSFIIHNSPHNVAGVVFIIILCKEKRKILDWTEFDDSDGFELLGFNLAVTSVQGGKLWKL